MDGLDLLSRTNIEVPLGQQASLVRGNSESNIHGLSGVTMDHVKHRFQQHAQQQYGTLGGMLLRPWIHELYQTKSHKKSQHEFELYLVQGIRAHSDSIWVAKFSPDGQFLATGGKDAVLKIWQVNQLISQHKICTDDPKQFSE